MPISDYDDSISLTVQSISGTPTISKVQPIYLVDADGVVRGLLWVYNDWVRDGTIQAKIAFGDGPEDRSMDGTGNNPWNYNSDSEIIHHLSNNPIKDSSPHGNDPRGSFGVTYGEDGVFGDAVKGDGVDDYVDINLLPTMDIFTIVTYSYPLSLNDGDDDFVYGIRENNFKQLRYFGDGTFGFYSYNGPNGSISVNQNWHCNVITCDGSTLLGYMNKSEYVNGSWGSETANNNNDRLFGWNGNTNGNLILDEFKVFQGGRSKEWADAEYDASDIGGQSFFSRNSSSGPFQIYFSKIDGFSDIAVYDQNDNLLDYEIEKLNPPTNTPGSITDTDDSGVTQTDSDGVVTTG